MATKPLIRHAVRTTLIMLSWVPVAVTVNQTLGYVTWIQGSSMKPALNPDESLGWRDLVVLYKFGQRSAKALHVGDVVMIRSPQDPEKVLVKRILGMPYDTVAPRPTGEYPRRKVTIPPNHIWVEGDNATHSIDSNVFGPVSIAMVVGRATTVVFPPSRWGAVPDGGREARIPSVVESIDDWQDPSSAV